MSSIDISQNSPITLNFGAIKKFLGAFWSSDLAMDLGTANTLVYARGVGIVLNEPSIVAVNTANNKIYCMGREAREVFGKTSGPVKCIRPMRDGVISDFKTTAMMMKHMLGQVCNKMSLRKPRMVIGVPASTNQVEKKAVIDAALYAGAGKVMLVEEPMATAIGIGLPVHRPVANMVVDIGGGTTEIAIISMNATSYSQSMRVAGDEMDEAIQRAIKQQLDLEIGIFEAERIKMIIGSALASEEPMTLSIFGRDIKSSIPRQVEIEEDIVRQALNEPLSAIISGIVTALEQSSPELAQDVVGRGIYIGGGGSLIKGLPERLERETGLTFTRAQDPLSCVVRGLGHIVENLGELKELCIA